MRVFIVLSTLLIAVVTATISVRQDAAAYSSDSSAASSGSSSASSTYGVSKAPTTTPRLLTTKAVTATAKRTYTTGAPKYSTTTAVKIRTTSSKNGSTLPTYKPSTSTLPPLTTSIGYTNDSIDGSFLCTVTECQLGNLVCDALLSYLGPAYGPTVCITNGDSINGSLGAGNITAGDLAKALPYRDDARVLEITGSTLLSVLETGLTALGNKTQKGQFPQIGGMLLTVKNNAPKGSRVSSLAIANVSVIPTAKYTVITNDFLADGGYGYSWGAYKNLTKAKTAVNDIVKEYLGKNNPYKPPPLGRISNATIGYATAAINGTPPACRTGECPMGDLQCDALLASAGPLQGADVCIVNGGSVRASIDAGNITNDEIHDGFPFDDVSFVVKIPGSTLLSALENGFSAIGNATRSGRFPQVGGLSVTYDSSKPVGRRVVSVTIGSSSIVPSKLYTLVTTDYLAAGGDGYLWPGSVLVKEYRLSVEVIIQKYIATNNPYKPAVQNRLRDVSKTGGK